MAYFGNCARFALLLICLGVPTGFSAAAGAQVSAYGAVALSNYGFSNNGNSYSFKGDNASLIGGAFYNFPIDSRVTAGIDGRLIYGPGSKGGVASTAALRIGFVPHRSPLRPYFQIGGGLVSAVQDRGFVSERSTNGAATFLFGLDFRLTPKVDLRIAELGSAAGTTSTNTSNINTTHSGVAFLDAGVVYHFGVFPGSHKH